MQGQVDLGFVLTSLTSWKSILLVNVCHSGVLCSTIKICSLIDYHPVIIDRHQSFQTDFAYGVILCCFPSPECRFRVFFPALCCGISRHLGVTFYPDKEFTQTYMVSLSWLYDFTLANKCNSKDNVWIQWLLWTGCTVNVWLGWRRKPDIYETIHRGWGHGSQCKVNAAQTWKLKFTF